MTSARWDDAHAWASLVSGHAMLGAKKKKKKKLVLPRIM